MPREWNEEQRDLREVNSVVELDARVVIKKIAPTASRTRCNSCIRPIGYRHQAQCPQANTTRPD